MTEFSPQTGEMSPAQLKEQVGSPGTGTGVAKPPGCRARQGPGDVYGTDLLT